MIKGLLVEIDITDLVWDEQTDGTYKYALDRIDEFIDELSDSNKIIPNNFKDSSNPAILIQINNKLISHVKFQSSDWDEDAMHLSLFLVLDFKSGDALNNYFLKQQMYKSVYCYFPVDNVIVYQAYSYGSYHNSIAGYYNPNKNANEQDFINYSGDKAMINLYNQAKSILLN
jgi:hypothetical protein